MAHPDNSLEIFDERQLVIGNMLRENDQDPQDQSIAIASPQKPMSLRDEMSEDFNMLVSGQRRTTLSDLFRFIAETLRTYQSYHYQDIIDPWIVTFPFARYVADGDLIINRNTGETYRIDRVLDDELQMKSNRVKLAPLSSNAKAPGDTVRLLLEQKNMIDFHWAYNSRDEVKEFQSSPGGIADLKPFTDTLTFGIIRKQPGGAGQPFEGVKEVSPRFRRNKQDSRDASFILEEKGQFFDSLVEIGCWSSSVSRAESLLEWFELFFHRNRWVWKFNGIDRIFYWERRRDSKSQVLRSDAFSRQLILFARTEEVWIERQRRIKCLDYVLNVQGLSTVEQIIDQTGVCNDISFTINDRSSAESSGLCS